MTDHDIIIQRMYEEGIPRSRISEYKLANKLYKWQRKNKPCPHGFTKICASGCFWTERHRKNMQYAMEVKS